jgi:RNA polymerase sigma factor for flagellar operon FliA
MLQQQSPERSAPLTYTAAGMVASDSLVRQYTPLVKRIAHHMIARLPASVQLDDLVQAGMMGLLDAASRFDEAQGIQFETFAAQRVRGAMLDELRESDWLPRSARKAQRDIDTAMQKVQQRERRAATESEVAREMNVPLAQYQQLLSDARGSQLVHIDELQGDDESFFERNLPDEREEPSARLADKRFKKALVEQIGSLPEREKLMMGLYYEEELNFREIAAVLGVTESRVCQMHSQAVSRLRVGLKDWGAKAKKK